MANIAKLLSGIFVVLLLTYAAFYGRGMGERTINDLTARANQELVNHNLVGVTVAFEASPVRRVAHLRGNLPPAQMAQAIHILPRVHRVAEAGWDPQCSKGPGGEALPFCQEDSRSTC